MTDQSPKKQITSDFTSKVEGEDLGEMRKLWRDTAASEMGLSMMSGLKGKNLGFNEVENFSLGLQYNFKSEKMKDLRNKPTEKIIEAVMTTKMRDEIHHYYELRRKREMKVAWPSFGRTPLVAQPACFLCHFMGALVKPSVGWEQNCIFRVAWKSLMEI